MSHCPFLTETNSKISTLLQISLHHKAKSSRIDLIFTVHIVYNIRNRMGSGQDPLLSILYTVMKVWLEIKCATLPIYNESYSKIMTLHHFSHSHRMRSSGICLIFAASIVYQIRNRIIQIQIQIQKYFIASCLTISSVHNNSQWYNTSSTFDPTWVYNSDITSRKHRMSTLYLGLQLKSK